MKAMLIYQLRMIDEKFENKFWKKRVSPLLFCLVGEIERVVRLKHALESGSLGRLTLILVLDLALREMFIVARVEARES